MHHTAEDADIGLRAHFPRRLRITKCHEDVLHGDGRGALLRYCTTYLPKFSDSFASEYLDDGASDYAVARRVLFDFHPLEPEMWMMLAQQMFPMSRYQGTLVPIIAPYPDMETKPQFVMLYETCPWRDDCRTLLDFLRKTNAKGEIISWLKKKYQQSDESQTLHAFANALSLIHI